MSEPVCKRCGTTKFVLTGEVEIRVQFTRKVLEVGWGPPIATKPKDRVTRKFGHREDDDARWALDDALDQPDHVHYTCQCCGLEEDELADLVIQMPVAGVRVNLPDGRVRAADHVYIGNPLTHLEYIDRVPDTAARIMLAFHDQDGVSAEVYSLEHVELWQPNPDQLELLEAA